MFKTLLIVVISTALYTSTCLAGDHRSAPSKGPLVRPSPTFVHPSPRPSPRPVFEHKPVFANPRPLFIHRSEPIRHHASTTVIYTPAPVTYVPTPVIYTSAPVVYNPIIYTPAPVIYAPVVTESPVYVAPSNGFYFSFGFSH